MASHETRVIADVRPLEASPRRIGRDFLALLDSGAELLPVGEARDAPELLLHAPYLPRHAIELFDAVYYLTDFLFEEGLDFFVAYVGLRDPRTRRVAKLHPRIFYKDSSLVWRVASHVIRTNGEDWIGKGDVKWVRNGDGEHLESDEDTTNLPYELQAALDTISRRKKARRNDDAICLVLRNAPEGRIRPYSDFTRPRRLAEERGRIHGGRAVARITRRGDPTSVRFARGFEPDFGRGVVEIAPSGSRLYGGAIDKYRIRSKNGQVQYMFVASPTHVWINPPQTFTTELTTYGLRALHVLADDEIFVPGYEYHYFDDDVDPPELCSQIPEGYAGEPSPNDSGRADASPWIEKMPVIREFRRKVVGPKRAH